VWDVDKQGRNALMLAAEEMRINMVQWLLQPDKPAFDLSTVDIDGRTAFVLAASTGCSELVQLLHDAAVERGQVASLWSTGTLNGKTALMSAIDRGRLFGSDGNKEEIVELLMNLLTVDAERHTGIVDAMEVLNKREWSGHYTLSLAASKILPPSIADLLLRTGADPQIFYCGLGYF
jgi:ankyrin repeat protein